MADLQSYQDLPASASHSLIQRCQINIDEAEISRMRTLIELANIPAACYENSEGSRHYGVQRDWLIAMRQRWLSDFSWKDEENRLNRFNHYKAKVEIPNVLDDGEIHFVGLFSERADAIPIILLHGWPGSFLEFLPIVQLVANKYTPANLPYHLTIPSLPGYVFSPPPPTDQSAGLFTLESVAQIMDKLMLSLFGPSKYIAQGGDVGSRVARILAAQFSNCVAAHLNYSPLSKEPSSDQVFHVEEVEKQGLERRSEFVKSGSAYAQEQGTRPSTLGLVLSSNPLALLAWVGEKFLDWSDPDSFDYAHDDPSSPFADELLLSVSLYWLSGSIATTFYSYKETILFGKGHDSPEFHIRAPKAFGHSWFPKELQAMPISWVQTTGNLVWWRRHDVGGHFAAFEQPKRLWADIEEFVELVQAK